ncbi:MAG TPA: LAGLIDADG family homing endonuclease, partial [Pyrinomonadaceae bacterium]|nr:LAGLIDADG family homing endonuclease [Pyrinomonadaceae bacterium]
MAGDTPVLMADGRTKPLADLSVGDRIYGTERRGDYRRYVATEVLAHWGTLRPAYRITLEDGTELVASGDHRFLTDRGWKHVTGSEQGPNRRPHLTLNNKLLGTGGFSASPIHTPDYQRGYLCGMVRGDGHVGSYSYVRPGRNKADVHRFRLALIDLEALRRTRQYLASIGVQTTEFVFQKAVGNYKTAHAIRTSTRSGVEAIREAICWPTHSQEEWSKGFLAGIFDAEGSRSCGVFRISNCDSTIIEQIEACLSRFEFSFTTERPDRPSRVAYVRLVGGLKEHLRFFHTVDPAITRKRSIEGTSVKSNARTNVVSIVRTGVDIPMFDITTGTGDFIANGVVSHNCFART